MLPNTKRKIATRPSFRIILVVVAFVAYSSTHLTSYFTSSKHYEIRRMSTKSIGEADPLAPEVAWIVSYPCSGHDHIVDMIQALTKSATATNYGHVVEEVNGKHNHKTYLSEPLFVEHVNGPFIFSGYLPLPIKALIPTVTYCGGYCIDCYPGKYILERDEFIQACLTGTHFEPSEFNNGENGYGITNEVQYSGDLVKKALHLIRDPFDVVESRFLYLSHYYTGELDWTASYNPTSEGFYTFCAEAKVKFADEERKWHWPEDYKAATDVPCHHEFYKIIQWHNYVFETFDYLEILYDHFYYEEFDTDYQNQARRMLDFFEAAPITKPEKSKVAPPFRVNQTLFKPEDKVKIKAFIESEASHRTLAVLDRYLSEL